MFAAYDNNGYITGFYLPEIHGEDIPANSIAITEEQWRDCIHNQGKWLVDVTTQTLILSPVKVITNEEKLAIIRAERNRLISATDWLMLPDVPLTSDNRTQWQQYRQALRDFTDSCDVDKPVWPTKPEYVTAQ